MGAASADATPGVPIRVRRLRWRDRAEALARLQRDPAANLMLLDHVARLGVLPPARGPRGTLAAAWEEDRLVGILAIRPSVLLDAGASPEAVSALAPCLEGVSSGLIRSPAEGVELLWRELSGRGRRAIVDRLEVAYRLDLPAPEGAAIADTANPADTVVGAVGAVGAAGTQAVSVREARAADLEDLVIAARASLREEGRPDPFHGDPEGFRAWVRGRLPRARVAEHEGRVVFVAYADVQRPEGWLLQGVYTWPEHRRRGFARAGVSALARAAAEAGAAHVQLAVVRGNRPAERLYQGLGFRPFQTLRTILFG